MQTRLTRFLPMLAFAHDLIMAGLSFGLAMYLRLGDDFTGDYVSTTIIGLPLFIGVSAISFRIFRLYRGLWRFASMRDLFLLGQAATLAVLVFLPVLYYFHLLQSIPRSVPLITWFVLLILLGAPRFLYRSIKDRRLSFNRMAGRVPVLLVGAGAGAEQFIRAMSNMDAPYVVVGVLDDAGETLTGRKIHGITIMGGIDALDQAIETLRQRGRQPQRIVITKGNGEITGVRLGKLIDKADALGMNVGLMPSLTEFRDATVTEALALNPIAIEDLLGRPQNILDQRPIEALARGKRVLITGAGGTIGSELARQVAGLEPDRLVIVDHGEFNLYMIERELVEKFPALALTAYIADVRDADRVAAIFDVEKPQIVFHAAALKHVPLVEKNPCEGVLTNTIGTRTIADAAKRIGAAAMVQISTDKAVKPINVMGASKRLAEAYTQALDLASQDTRFMTVRFGNVLGSTGSVVPLFRHQIAQGGPITVTHPDVERYFMTCREAVQLVLQASAHGLEGKVRQGRIFVLDMGNPVKIVDLARRMVVLSGLRPDHDIEIKFIGLRTGEKLTERLFESDEALDTTDLPGIMSAAPLAIELETIREALAALEEVALHNDERALRTMIGRMLPEFATANWNSAAA